MMGLVSCKDIIYQLGCQQTWSGFHLQIDKCLIGSQFHGFNGNTQCSKCLVRMLSVVQETFANLVDLCSTFISTYPQHLNPIYKISFNKWHSFFLFFFFFCFQMALFSPLLEELKRWLFIPNNCKNGHDNDVVLDAADDVGDSWRESYPWEALLGTLPLGEMIVMRLGILPLSDGPKQLKTTHLAQYQLALF